MSVSPAVLRILRHYAGEPPGVLVNLARLLSYGQLAGTGKMVILPVDQGFEHGPVCSFSAQMAGLQPCTHAAFAEQAGCSAHVAPLGALSLVAGTAPNVLPLILKLNHSETLSVRQDKQSSWTASVEDALRLGCVAVGLTLYTGSALSHEAYQQARETIAQARAVGLPTIVWAYPRGQGLSAEDERAIDVVAYAAHIACQLGAHIVKAKPPTAHVVQAAAAKALRENAIPIATLAERIAYLKLACFGGSRLLLCSGGASQNKEALLAEVEQLAAGGADGSIIGRNMFQRPEQEAKTLIDDVAARYRAHA